MDSINISGVESVEKDSKYEEPVRKRRSSIFQSRTCVFDDHEDTKDAQDLGNQSCESVTHATECARNVVQEETFDLEKYVSDLKEERKMWLTTWKQRKAQRRNLTRQKLELEKEGQAMNLNALMDPEKAFVLARPNYENMYKSSQKLLDTSWRIALLSQLVYEANRRFIQRMDKKLIDTTKQIISLSES